MAALFAANIFKAEANHRMRMPIRFTMTTTYLFTSRQQRYATSSPTTNDNLLTCIRFMFYLTVIACRILHLTILNTCSLLTFLQRKSRVLAQIPTRRRRMTFFHGHTSQATLAYKTSSGTIIYQSLPILCSMFPHFETFYSLWMDWGRF